jgi:GWxTD domain-containing protein
VIRRRPTDLSTGRSPVGGGLSYLARRTGAAAALLGLVAALLGLVAAVPAAAGLFPAASTGDIWFQADHAGFRDSTGAVTEEFYIRLPNNQIVFNESESDSGVDFEGRVFARLEFYDETGDRIGQATRPFEFHAGSAEQAKTPDRVQLLVIREPLHPRTHDVEVTVEDLNARKRGLIYLFTKKKKNGTLRARLAAPPDSGALGISDLQFAWSTRRAAPGSPFFKNGWSVVPNPGRTFGLYLDTLHVYAEIRDRDAGRDATLQAVKTVRDATGRALGAETDTLRLDDGFGIQLVSMPLAGLPAGTYDLSIRLTGLASGRTAESVRAFNVLWEEGSWARTEEEVLAEARAVLPEDDYDRFREMPFGDRESQLATFWASQDPSPNSAANERREIFKERVAFADRNFTTPLERGMTSDRGRVYIRYGPPDEVTREDLPRPGHTLSDVLDGGDFSEDLFSDRTDRSRRDGLTTANFQNVDTRPYEIWSYTTSGQPLFPERERLSRNTGLTFIFVDDQGIGVYTLRYSNTPRRF